MSGSAGNRPGRVKTLALVWKRFDFRESSRVVTLLSREHGLVSALAKGAHRPDSPFLGQIDFLNELSVVLSPDRGGLRLLLTAELRRERRALREPGRFLGASYLAELCAAGFFAERPEPDLFDLLTGGLALLERCPPSAIPAVVLGLELRYLRMQGALPDLRRCGACGRTLDGEAYRDERGQGLACRQHAGATPQPIPQPGLDLLERLLRVPGKELPEQDARHLAGAEALPERWLEAAMERRSRLRPGLFARTAEAGRGPPGRPARRR